MQGAQSQKTACSSAQYLSHGAIGAKPHLGTWGAGKVLPLQKQILGQQLYLMGKGTGIHTQGEPAPNPCSLMVQVSTDLLYGPRAG